MKTPILSRFLTAALVGVCLCLSVQAQSVSYFMKITGPNVPGTSVTSSGPTDGPTDFRNQIEVSSYSLGGIKPFEPGATTLESPFEFSGLECVMALDGKAYPLMFAGVASGTVYGEIILSGVSFGQPEAPLIFFKLEMKGVTIESMQLQGTNGDQPIVNAMFRPSSIRISTSFINPNGSTSTPVVFQRNLVTGAATY